MTSVLSGVAFKRLGAERHLKAESEGPLTADAILSDGTGATTIIAGFLTKASLPTSLVEEGLLKELNKITAPDICFTRISAQQHNNAAWEIYLHEEVKGAIPLSSSGSGLQTLILVLVNLYLIPFLENRELSTYIFAFEELENNLHPALQRNLHSYLVSIAKTYGCYFFLTTHSNVAIDLYFENELAQILHVTSNAGASEVKTISTHTEGHDILNDLDIRASDLLQSNGIIWVEGPSDRIYFNKWVELISNGDIKEGLHYQCVYYGGRILSHLSGETLEEEAENDPVKIFGLNRNAIILIDSDMSSEKDHLNDTKKRIMSEVNDTGGMVWVTKGKEIENYIPTSTFISTFEVSDIAEPESPFVDIFSYLDEHIKDGIGRRYRAKKTLLAEKLCSHMVQNDLENAPLDLKEKLHQVFSVIQKWNSLH